MDMDKGVSFDKELVSIVTIDNLNKGKKVPGSSPRASSAFLPVSSPTMMSSSLNRELSINHNIKLVDQHLNILDIENNDHDKKYSKKIIQDIVNMLASTINQKNHQLNFMDSQIKFYDKKNSDKKQKIAHLQADNDHYVIDNEHLYAINSDLKEDNFNKRTILDILKSDLNITNSKKRKQRDVDIEVVVDASSHNNDDSAN
jgi:hypothetical protein